MDKTSAPGCHRKRVCEGRAIATEGHALVQASHVDATENDIHHPARGDEPLAIRLSAEAPSAAE